MANLSDVLGDLITQIGKGRSQADMATLEIANAYKDHPLLSEFPIPRMNLDIVDVELKMSIASTPTSPTILTKESRSALMSQLKTIVNTFTSSEPSVGNLTQKSPKFQELWDNNRDATIKRLSNLFTTKTEIKTKSHAYAAASIIMNQLLSTATSSSARIDVKVIRKFLDKDVISIEENMQSQIEKVIDKSLKLQSDDKGAFEILVTASELENISPEKITTVKLTLRESDRDWTRIETDKGIKEKLIPH